jgi:hypothetical protein
MLAVLMLAVLMLAVLMLAVLILRLALLASTNSNVLFFKFTNLLTGGGS